MTPVDSELRNGWLRGRYSDQPLEPCASDEFAWAYEAGRRVRKLRELRKALEREIAKRRGQEVVS